MSYTKKSRISIWYSCDSGCPGDDWKIINHKTTKTIFIVTLITKDDNKFCIKLQSATIKIDLKKKNYKSLKYNKLHLIKICLTLNIIHFVKSIIVIYPGATHFVSCTLIFSILLRATMNTSHHCEARGTPMLFI